MMNKGITFLVVFFFLSLLPSPAPYSDETEQRSFTYQVARRASDPRIRFRPKHPVAYQLSCFPQAITQEAEEKFKGIGNFLENLSAEVRKKTEVLWKQYKHAKRLLLNDPKSLEKGFIKSCMQEISNYKKESKEIFDRKMADLREYERIVREESQYVDLDKLPPAHSVQDVDAYRENIEQNKEAFERVHTNFGKLEDKFINLSCRIINFGRALEREEVKKEREQSVELTKEEDSRILKEKDDDLRKPLELQERSHQSELKKEEIGRWGSKVENQNGNKVLEHPKKQGAWKAYFPHIAIGVACIPAAISFYFLYRVLNK